MLLINSLCLADSLPTLGLYQCVLTADWDLGALLYLIHNRDLSLPFTAHILSKRKWLLKVIKV